MEHVDGGWMSKQGGGAAMWVAGAAVAAVLAPFMLFVGVSGGEADAGLAAGSGTLNPKHVPPQYVTWVLKAGSVCPEIPPPVIAAQIEAESGWINGRVSPPPANAKGLSQFIDETWAEWGRDDDGNGQISVWDPGDAIMAQGRYDCSLAKQVAGWRAKGLVSGDIIDLALAAYNAGPYRVLKAGGIPDIDETQGYVRDIRASMAKYTQIDTGGGTVPAGQLMAVPLRGNPPVTSPFGMRVHPTTGVYKLHTGMDFGVGEGTPVLAAKEGVVTFAGWNTAYGNRVIISHGTINGAQISTTYNHMSALNVGVGQQVGVGAVVGLVGTTGYSTGAHLHFEVQRNGECVNPAPWIGR
ncbi:peptidoglycan DD-metalloendopeptidase family protein [Streptomyces sp. NPDC001546]|uniref:peptidoglycan DD-metalloendopeptidase family protein n=1 Tax=Streptomyces sp. NPDC001546 TaxID=3364585 RepID=UPI00367A5C79